MRDEYSLKVAINDSLIAQEVNQMSILKEKYQTAFSTYEDAKSD